MIDIIKLLKENKDITDYKVNGLKRTSHESFYVKGKLETVRATDIEEATVTVYVDGDGVKGILLSVYASMTEEIVSAKIKAAAERAKLVKNKAYDIPSGDKLEVAISSNFTDYEISDLSKKIMQAVKKADCYENGSINALEIFIYKDIVSVKNSRGVDKSEVSYRAMIEAIPTWTENGESVELYEAYHFTNFNADEITAEIDDRMKEVRDRRVAKKIDACKMNVILPHKELSRMMSEIVDSLNFISVYSHANVFSKGDKIQKDRVGDVINLTMRHEIKGSRFSAVFDGDGVTLKDKKVIDGGVAVAYFGNHRFGSYLGEDITGNLSCMSLEKGTLTDEEIAKSTYIECVSLSGIQLDLYSDYIGGEIRLAYLCENGKKTPITGISMSGKLSEVLNSIRFSTEVISKDRLEGPKNALLVDMAII